MHLRVEERAVFLEGAAGHMVLRGKASFQSGGNFGKVESLGKFASLETEVPEVTVESSRKVQEEVEG